MLLHNFQNKTNWCWTLGARCIEKCDSHGWSCSAFCWKCSFVNHSSNQKMAFYLTFIRQLPIISSCTRTRIYLQPRRQFADRTQIPISCLPCKNQVTSQIHLRRRHKSIFAVGQKSSSRVGVWGTTGATAAPSTLKARLLRTRCYLRRAGTAVSHAHHHHPRHYRLGHHHYCHHHHQQHHHHIVVSSALSH